MKPEFVRAVASKLPSVEERVQRDHLAWGVNGRYFARLKGHDLLFALTSDQQREFLERSPLFAPLPGEWGGRGWMVVSIDVIDTTMLQTVLEAAHAMVASPEPPGTPPKRA